RFYGAAMLAGPAAIALSWLLMKFFNVWLPFPPFLATLVVVVPGLEVAKLVLVNRDLDGKIERLTAAALYEQQKTGGYRTPPQSDARERILADLPPGPDRDGWLSAMDTHEKQSALEDQHRARLFRSHRRNSRWKLEAVDHFSGELVQFLSFNNAILASIED